MSNLQELVNCLVQVIVNYNESQTSIDYPLESYINKSPAELHDFLNLRITEATTGWETRGPLLNYFLYTIDKVKPLTDQKAPLSVSQRQIVSNSLTALLSNVTKLMQLSQSNSLTIKFGENTEEMWGFIRGAAKFYTICISGQIIEKALFAPYKFTKDTNFAAVIEQMIGEHQFPLIEVEKEKLKQTLLELEASRALAESLKGELESEKEQKQKIVCELNSAVETIELLHKDINSVKSLNDSLQEERALDKTKISDLESEKASLIEKLEALTALQKTSDTIITKHTSTIGELREQVNSLRSAPELAEPPARQPGVLSQYMGFGSLLFPRVIMPGRMYGLGGGFISGSPSPSPSDEDTHSNSYTPE